MVIMTTIPFLLLFLLLIQQVHFSISASPGDLYINGVVYNTNAEITLYNGGSLSIQATNSHYMCILLMSIWRELKGLRIAICECPQSHSQSISDTVS